MYLIVAMLSILIPTYNTNIEALTIEIHRQCEKLSFPFEIHLLDDASTIKTVQKGNSQLAQLSNSFYHQNEVNLGRTSTRQRLAELASYPWLLFLDADVQPKYANFIHRFELDKQQESDIIFGGIAYQNEAPKLEEMLRWKYGKEREAKSVNERLKTPHFIISQNLLIKKEAFFRINKAGENKYGLDNIVSYEILIQGIKIKHIDNPVYHLGLETTETFLGKSIDSLRTTLHFVRNSNLPEDFRPIQKVYLRIKRMGLLGLFQLLLKPFIGKIERNLRSSNPNLKYFDLYRLHHFIHLNKQDHV